MQPGDIISGKYRLVRLIGDGGMGSVFEARHQVLGTPVALKFLHAELARRPGLAARFLQEARVSASIQSPHVARVTDVDQTADGAPYLVMELLLGESLQALLDRGRKLPQGQAIDFGVQIAAGLEAAHAIGVVHRDLKPDNVFITPSTAGPVLKLLDFGIAKLKTGEYQKGLTRPGAVMGTPEYMAPEQLYAADQVDARADVYSLGAMLYEMLSGERPAYGQDAAGIIAQVATGKVRRLSELEPSLPPNLVDIVHRAMAADRAQRFGAAAELRGALLSVASSPSHAGPIAAAQVPPSRDTVDEPVLPIASKSAVAPTLPPDDEASVRDAQAKGATVEAPKELIRRITSANAAANVAPAGYTPPPHVAGASHVSLPTSPLRRRRKPWGAIIGIALGVAAMAGVVVLLASQRRSDAPAPTLDLTGTADGAVAAAATGAPAVVQPELQPEAPPAQQGPPPQPAPRVPPSRPSVPAPAVDAGRAADAGATVDAGGMTPFPTLPLPSGLPPLPSGFPSSLPTAFPSGFPQFPGLPGMSPPPAAPPPAPGR
jgi:serine/threonine-protein kinase